MKPARLFLCLSAAALLLNGCMYNSAAFVFDRASHDARAYTAEISPGEFVYTDGFRYFVELNHYRYDDRLIRQYPDIYADEPITEMSFKGKLAVEVSPEYARYITGQSAQPVALGRIIGIRSADFPASFARLPITVKPAAEVIDYRYRSANAPWFYALGVLDRLAVDVPVTLIQNFFAVVHVMDGEETGGYTEAELKSYMGIMRYPETYNSLVNAIHDGNQKTVHRMLEDGCNPNVQSQITGDPLLTFAAWTTHAYIVQELLSYGANPNLENNTGWTPLFMACVMNAKAVVRLLIDAEADVNHVAKDGITPLRIAERKGHHTIVRMLRNAGAVR